MFDVDVLNRHISMSIGDTGGVTFRAVGYTFQSADRALFTIKQPNGTVMMERLCPMEDNSFTVYFNNSDTEKYSAGDYSWDVRYIINPHYTTNVASEQTAETLEDGDQIITPYPPSTLTLNRVVGNV